MCRRAHLNNLLPMYCDCAQRGSCDVFPAASLTLQTPPPSYMAATHVSLQAAQSPTYAANTSSSQVRYSCHNIFTTPVGVHPGKFTSLSPRPQRTPTAKGSLLSLVETQFNWLCLALKFRMSLSKIFNERL